MCLVEPIPTWYYHLAWWSYIVGIDGLNHRLGGRSLLRDRPWHFAWLAGVSVLNFLRQALSARKGIDFSILELRLAIMEWMERLDMDPSFADRYLNDGFSGGEKKRNEVLQMAILEPDVAILDETDSGLDIDALNVVADAVNRVKDETQLGVLIITHYQRLLDELHPDRVHVMIDGRIVESGGPEIAARLEAEGYDAWR